MNKSKLFMFVSIAILAVTIVVSGATYAWYTWSTGTEEETKIVTNLGTATVYYDAGSNIEGVSLKPVSSKEEGIVKGITIKSDRNTTYKLSFNLYLDVIELGEGLKDASFKYSLYKDSTLVKEGNFSSDSLTTNLVTCTTNSTSHIVLLNNETITTTKSVYTLYIWIDGTMSNPNTMQNQTFNFKLHADGQNAVLGETASQYITRLYEEADKTVVTNNSIEYNYASSVSLMNDRLGGTTSDYNAGNIRYYGSNPNNYIDIGDVFSEDVIIEKWQKNGYSSAEACYQEETAWCDSYWSIPPYDSVEACYSSNLEYRCGTTVYAKDTTKSIYRIIGVFKDVELADGSKQDLIKVVRKESIGGYSWDTSESTVNNGYGINEWSQADLMKLLNPGYESEAVGRSLYWNSGSGTCYNGQSNATTSCDFTLIGLSPSAQNKIASVVWNLGGIANVSIYPNQAYEYERGTNVISAPIDGISRTTSWTGKVVLMYPSDYGYIADFNSCTATLNSYQNECSNKSWYRPFPRAWFLTTGTSNEYTAFTNDYDNLSSFNVNFGSDISPTFYLNSDSIIISGDGTESNPYVIG